MALVHGLLVAGLWQWRAWNERARVIEQPPLIVRLLAQPAPRRLPETMADPRQSRPRAHAPLLPQRTELQAITLPPALPAPAAALLPAEVAPSADRAASRPLQLKLPRAALSAPASRHPGLDDPRSNTAPATLESRIGAAAGGDTRLREERIDGERVRLRSASGCVEASTLRDAQLDPFNQSARASPRLIKPGC